MIRHATDTPHARIGIFAETTKVAKDGGCWTDLINSLEREWFAADTGLGYKTTPRVDAQTRQLYCEIQNRHGNSSRFVLNSLHHDDDIEETIKGKRYSMIWFNELSNFKSRKVFDISIEQLRMMGLDFGAHQWIADTNPAEEGEDSWIYKLWYDERLDDNHPDPKFRDHLGITEIMIPDNPFLSDEEKEQLYAQYRHDPDLFNRYALGLWTQTSTDSHFADVFRLPIHVIGDIASAREEDWEILLPEEGCTELVTGWDIGSINHAIHFLEPTIMGGKPLFKVLDEIVLLKQNISLADLTAMVLEKMDFWERQVGKPVQWRHWSDKSAFDHFRPAAELYDYKVVYEASDGRIILAAAPKFKDSVRQRVSLARRLLFENRLIVSAKCISTINMFRALKRGKLTTQFIDPVSRHKHPFDSLTYALASELPAEFNEAALRQGKANGKVIVASV